MAGAGGFIAVAAVIIFGYAYATNMLSRFGLACKPPFCLGQQAFASSGAAGGGAGAGAGGQGAGDVATGFHAGCARDANPGGNSPGWYTQGSNKEGLHHHCDWKQKCCFCTDVPKCIASGTPPWRPGDCRPDWGTASYLGGGPYPATADFSKCPAGTGP